MKLILTSLFLSALLLLNSCRNSKQASDAPTSNNPQPTSAIKQNPSNTATAKSESIEFKREGGIDAFTLKLKENGAKLVDANNQELIRLNTDEKQKIKIKNSADKSLGYVVTKNGYWKLENAAQSQELYVLRRQADGDYKLENAANKEIYRIKVRDYGFEIETPTKQSLYKVKTQEGKVSLRDATDKTVLYTKSGVAPIAIACFGFDVLTPEQKAALAYAVTLSGGQ